MKAHNQGKVQIILSQAILSSLDGSQDAKYFIDSKFTYYMCHGFLPQISHQFCQEYQMRTIMSNAFHKIRSFKPSHIRSSSHTMPLLNRHAHSKATFGDRSFSFASSVWNSIPSDVRCAPSLSSLKSRLKTFLFCSVYKD